MRYRALDANGDMTFGQGAQNFLVNSPQCVAQAVLTALKLSQGDWFLDLTDGVPYATQILGNNTASTRDQAVKNVILGVADYLGRLVVKSILNYSSTVVNRLFSVEVEILTIFGSTTINFSAGAGGFQGGSPWVFQS